MHAHQASVLRAVGQDEALQADVLCHRVVEFYPSAVAIRIIEVLVDIG